MACATYTNPPSIATGLFFFRERALFLPTYTNPPSIATGTPTTRVAFARGTAARLGSPSTNTTRRAARATMWGGTSATASTARSWVSSARRTQPSAKSTLRGLPLRPSPPRPPRPVRYFVMAGIKRRRRRRQSRYPRTDSKSRRRGGCRRRQKSTQRRLRMLVRQGALRTEHVCGRKAGGDVLLVGGGFVFMCVYTLRVLTCSE